jgi:hypothetical protein
MLLKDSKNIKKMLESIRQKVTKTEEEKNNQQQNKK